VQIRQGDRASADFTRKVITAQASHIGHKPGKPFTGRAGYRHEMWARSTQIRPHTGTFSWPRTGEQLRQVRHTMPCCLEDTGHGRCVVQMISRARVSTAHKADRLRPPELCALAVNFGLPSAPRQY